MRLETVSTSKHVSRLPIPASTNGVVNRSDLLKRFARVILGNMTLFRFVTLFYLLSLTDLTCDMWWYNG